ncbi:MAG: BamA/TamA family outer membrane protein [Polyangiales bacterium]
MLLAPGVAAQDKPTDAPSSPQHAKRGLRRAMPDYDGRPGPHLTLGEKLLWVPRVLFYPVHLVAEYGLRWPLGLAISSAEEGEVPAKIIDFFTFGEDDNITVLPTAFYDFGFRPSGGLFVAWDDFIRPDHKARLHAATGGKDYLTLTAAHRIEPSGKNWRIGLRGEATTRPDGVYYGIGQDIEDDNRSRFDFTFYDVALHFAEEFWRSSAARVEGGIRWAEFGNNVCCGDLSVQDQVNAGRFATLPPGFEEGYFIWRQQVGVVVDSRRPRPAPGSGWRLGARGSYATDVQEAEARQWLGYAALAAMYWDLSQVNHVLSVTASAQFVDAVRGEVPFFELVDLAGTGPMLGFIQGRLLGQSGIAASVEYRWPVWVWLDGSAHFALGNAFAERLDDFALRRLRMSYGVGLRTSNARDHSFDLTVAFGSRAFEDGPRVESFRFVIGGRRDF